MPTNPFARGVNKHARKIDWQPTSVVGLIYVGCEGDRTTQRLTDKCHREARERRSSEFRVSSAYRCASVSLPLHAPFFRHAAPAGAAISLLIPTTCVERACGRRINYVWIRADTHDLLLVLGLEKILLVRVQSLWLYNVSFEKKFLWEIIFVFLQWNYFLSPGKKFFMHEYV